MDVKRDRCRIVLTGLSSRSKRADGQPALIVIRDPDEGACDAVTPAGAIRNVIDGGNFPITTNRWARAEVDTSIAQSLRRHYAAADAPVMSQMGMPVEKRRRHSRNRQDLRQMQTENRHE